MRRCKLRGNGPTRSIPASVCPAGRHREHPRWSIRRCGLRQSRYIGLAKTHLQHIAVPQL